MSGDRVPSAYQAFIASDRVSARTRAALLARVGAGGAFYVPVALNVAQLAVLRAVLLRVVPQHRIDLAAMLDAQLGAAQGDGWRFGVLPADATAWARGLDALEHAAAAQGAGFADLDDAAQDRLLAEACGGGWAGGGFDGTQMRFWFQELCGDAAKAYMAHPLTLAGLGFSGIGYGGDGPDKPGYALVGAGEREAWEPLPEPGEDAA